MTIIHLIIIISASAVIIVSWGYLIRRARRGRAGAGASFERQQIKQQWEQITRLCNHRQEMNYKLAVIKANSLLEQALDDLGFAGATMAERFVQAGYRYPKIKKAVWAYKVSCQITNGKKYHLRYSVARKVLKVYRQALKDLKIY